MLVKYILSFFKLILLLITLTGYLNLLGQGRVQKYEGPYTLGDEYSGTAVYQYTVSRSDTIKQGAFVFESVTSGISNEDLFHSLHYKGNYEQGLKSGNWIYSAKKIRPHGSLKESNYQIIQQSVGKEFLVNGNFKDGRANGRWTLLEQSIENSIPSDTSILVSANFKDGILQGKVQGYYNDIEFSGSVDSEGFIDGQWHFNHSLPEDNSIDELRIYVNGIQVNHYMIVQGDTISIEYLGIEADYDSLGIWESLVLNGKYFEIIKNANVGLASYFSQSSELTLSLDTNQHIVSNSNALLEDVLSSFAGRDNILFWQLTSGSVPLAKVNAKLLKKPFSEVELANLAKARTINNELSKTLKDVFEDPSIELDRYANKDLMFYYAVLKIYESRIASISDILNRFSNQTYEYMNRDKIYAHLMKNSSYPEFVSFEFKDEQFEEQHEFASIHDTEYNAAEVIIDQLNNIQNKVSEILSVIDKILESKLTEFKLIEKERQLVKKKDSVIYLYSNAGNEESFNEYHRIISDRVQSYTLGIFRDYPALEMQEKVDTVDAILNCLDSFLKLYVAQTEIPSKLQRLNESYTRTVWNPYTMTDMQERMKERVYNAFITYLFPFYLDDIERSINCDDLENKHRNFELIYRKMMELREQDTRDIERALRGVNSAAKVLEIYNINLFVN